MGPAWLVDRFWQLRLAPDAAPVPALLRQLADAPPLAPPIPAAFARLGAR